MKSAGIFSLVVGLFLSLSLVASGQTVVEYSTATAAGSTGAAAGGKGVSKSIGGIFGGLNKTLEKVDKSGSGNTDSETGRVLSPASPTDVSRTVAASPVRDEAKKPIRPEDVKIGMARSALLDQFGKPFMKASRVEGPQYVESYYYQGSDDIIVVTLKEGRVAAVSPPPAASEPAKTASR